MIVICLKIQAVTKKINKIYTAGESLHWSLDTGSWCQYDNHRQWKRNFVDQFFIKKGSKKWSFLGKLNRFFCQEKQIKLTVWIEKLNWMEFSRFNAQKWLINLQKSSFKLISTVQKFVYYVKKQPEFPLIASKSILSSQKSYISVSKSSFPRQKPLFVPQIEFFVSNMSVSLQK